MENLKAGDFRIGNLVTDSSGFICEIKEIRSGALKVKYHSDKERYCMKSFCEIFSIKLTEEYILNMGFEKIREYFTIDNEFEIFKDKEGYYCYINSGSLYIKYVHQLQNLYYTLIREELQCSLGV